METEVKYYAYSMVYSEKNGDMKHFISHCVAHSKAEAKGMALDTFEDDHPDCKNLSLLIREITTLTDDNVSAPEAPTPEPTDPLTFRSDYIKPEFSLK